MVNFTPVLLLGASLDLKVKFAACFLVVPFMIILRKLNTMHF